MSRRRTIVPSRSRTMSCSNSEASRRSVSVRRSICTSVPFVRPTVATKLLRVSAACTSSGVTSSASMRPASSQMRIASGRAPSTPTRCTPGIV